jgi:hypothetical protein
MSTFSQFSAQQLRPSDRSLSIDFQDTRPQRRQFHFSPSTIWATRYFLFAFFGKADRSIGYSVQSWSKGHFFWPMFVLCDLHGLLFKPPYYLFLELLCSPLVSSLRVGRFCYDFFVTIRFFQTWIDLQSQRCIVTPLVRLAPMDLSSKPDPLLFCDLVTRTWIAHRFRSDRDQDTVIVRLETERYFEFNSIIDISTICKGTDRPIGLRRFGRWRRFKVDSEFRIGWVLVSFFRLITACFLSGGPVSRILLTDEWFRAVTTFLFWRMFSFPLDLHYWSGSIEMITVR